MNLRPIFIAASFFCIAMSGVLFLLKKQDSAVIINAVGMGLILVSVFL